MNANSALWKARFESRRCPEWTLKEKAAKFVKKRPSFTPPSPEAPIALLVLIVDDDAGTAKALRRLMRSYGHRVEVAHSAEEGLALARDVCPDLILHDIAMRSVDGYAAAGRLRQTPGLDGTILIACSGLVDEAKASAAGFDGWLHKPISTGELETVLAMAIERQRAQAGRTGRVK